jgi:hypothetical protein
MTAINPAKLKVQTAALGKFVDQPDQFVIKTHELLSFYSARIRQTNRLNKSQKLQTYQAPGPVISTLRNEIMESLEENPDLGYSLVDALWNEPWIEFRQLAIHILGILPTEESKQTLMRLQSWLETCPTEEIRQLIMTRGMVGLAEKNQEQSLQFIESLINIESKEALQAALFGLESFARDPSYLNLPLLFRYLSRILVLQEAGLIKEISALLLILASRSEQETTYYLLTQLGSNPDPGLLRVIRKVMKDLSQENQGLLREKLEPYKKNNL